MTSVITAPHPRGGPPFTFTAQTPEEIAGIAADLAVAQEDWAAYGVKGRIEIIERWRAALLKRRAEIVDALANDTGRLVLSEAEFDGMLRCLDYWVKKAPALLGNISRGVSETDPGVRYEHNPTPLGLVGVIGPWNFPLLLLLIDAIPALMAGCAVLAKPSEVTPRFVEPLTGAVRTVPELDAVLRFVQGSAPTGKAVVEHADAICFTGSVPTGRLVGAQAGRLLKPAFLELGGKDPLVVLSDADLHTAVAVALRASVIATGQACQSIERVYVHDSMFAPFVERLVAAARTVRLTAGGGSGGHLGPFIDPAQADRVQAQLADAESLGAAVHCGGVQRRKDGAWCAPTVLTGVHHGMLLFREETFGPVIPVMPFADDAEAVRLANDSEFGLSAAVLGEESHALAVARRLRAGAVSINDGGLTTQVSDVEKESFGVSGLGRSRAGPSALLRFLRKQALLVQTGAPVPIEAFEESGETNPPRVA